MKLGLWAAALGSALLGIVLFGFALHWKVEAENAEAARWAARPVPPEMRPTPKIERDPYRHYRAPASRNAVEAVLERDPPPAPLSESVQVTAELPADQPTEQVNKMYGALARLFPRVEAAKLTRLYFESREHLVPPYLESLPPAHADRFPAAKVKPEDLRAGIKAIVGEQGFKDLIAAAAPPPGTDKDEMTSLRYAASGAALLWWFQLKE